MRAPETLITSNPLFQLWHVDPKGDSGPACHDPGNWKLHVKHWVFKRPIWMYSFKWKYIQQCGWCGERGNKYLGRVDVTNHRNHYHSKCLSEMSKQYHEHDPTKCYNCSGYVPNMMPWIKPDMPVEQRSAIDGLNALVAIGVLTQKQAVDRYHKKKQAKQWM